MLRLALRTNVCKVPLSNKLSRVTCKPRYHLFCITSLTLAQTSTVCHASPSSVPSAHPHVSYTSHPHIKDVNSSTDAHFSTNDHSSASNVDAQKEMVYALKISQNEIVHSLQTSQKEMTCAQKEIAHNQKEIAHAQKEIECAQKEMASSLRWAYFDLGLILVFGISALAVLGFALQH